MKQETKQLHQRKRSKLSLSDEYETDDGLFGELCKKYQFFPDLDVCATRENSKCFRHFSSGGLEKPWQGYNWCNPPHSETELWVRKACSEFLVHKHKTMMIIPANSICTQYSRDCIVGKAQFYPIFKRPKFLYKGKPTKDSSRNSYFVVIWR